MEIIANIPNAIELENNLNRNEKYLVIIDPLASNTNRFCIYGICKFLKDNGVFEGFKMKEGYEDMKEYYNDIMQEIISVETTDDPSYFVFEEKDLMKENFEFYSDSIVQREVGKPYWYDWEGKPPHSTENVHIGPFPIFSSPTIVLPIMNLILNFKPDVVLDTDAYKFGFSALSALLVGPYAGKVISFINGAKSSEFDEYVVNFPQGHCIEAHHEIYDLESRKNIVGNWKKGLAIINNHNEQSLRDTVELIESSFEKAIIIFHAENHGDLPKFLEEYRKKAYIKNIKLFYNPSESYWCENSIFYMEK